MRPFESYRTVKQVGGKEATLTTARFEQSQLLVWRHAEPPATQAHSLRVAVRDSSEQKRRLAEKRPDIDIPWVLQIALMCFLIAVLSTTVAKR